MTKMHGVNNVKNVIFLYQFFNTHFPDTFLDNLWHIVYTLPIQSTFLCI
jgi:hypothetical protein